MSFLRLHNKFDVHSGPTFWSNLIAASIKCLQHCSTLRESDGAWFGIRLTEGTAVGKDAVLPTFRRIVVSSDSGWSSAAVYQSTGCHFPGYLHLQYCRSEHQKWRTFYVILWWNCCFSRTEIICRPNIIFFPPDGQCKVAASDLYSVCSTRRQSRINTAQYLQESVPVNRRVTVMDCGPEEKMYEWRKRAASLHYVAQLCRIS